MYGRWRTGHGVGVHAGDFGLDAAHAHFPETDAEEDGEGSYDEEDDEDGGVAPHCGGLGKLLWCGGLGELLWCGGGRAVVVQRIKGVGSERVEIWLTAVVSPRGIVKRCGR